jgi:hypothetical protein
MFVSILIGFFYWYFTKKSKEGKRAIIPQYEPPQNFKPAMAEVVCKEKITDKTWPATIVDLAVRGYLKIKEDKSYWGDFVVRILLIFPILFLFLLLFIFLAEIKFFYWLIFLIVLFLIILIIKRNKSFKELFFPKNYILEKNKNFDEKMEDYEKEFLDIICC